MNIIKFLCIRLVLNNLHLYYHIVSINLLIPFWRVFNGKKRKRRKRRENIWGPCNEMKLQQDTLLYLRASRCTTDTRTWERLDFGPTPRLISCANFGPLDVGRVKAALHAASLGRLSWPASALIWPTSLASRGHGVLALFLRPHWSR